MGIRPFEKIICIELNCYCRPCATYVLISPAKQTPNKPIALTEIQKMLFTHDTAGINHVLTLSTEEIEILAAHLNLAAPCDSVIYDFLKSVEYLVDEDAIIEYDDEDEEVA